MMFIVINKLVGKERNGEKMLLKTFRGWVGNLGSYTNTYVVSDEKTKESALIDVADNVEEISEYLESRSLKLKYIILTHCHADHMTGLRELKQRYAKAKVVIHEDDAPGLEKSEVNLSCYMEVEPNFVTADRTLQDGDVLEVGNLKLQVIHTPGHTKGSICLLVEDALFSGDTLFKGSHGRTDFPTGNAYEMQNSIQKLLQLPNRIIVYPGHDRMTQIGEEKDQIW